MFKQTINIGKILGIPFGVNNSWFIIFVLITLSLSTHFADLHPQWTGTQHLFLGIVTSLLFFVSILLHELGHSVVALHYKIPVKSITLFVFGGIAQIGREPEKPTEEFNIAIAGPIVSALLGGLFYACMMLAQGRSEGIATLGEWLGRINLTVAAFNLLPGFPLDGGRVLRAIVWKFTGSFERATITAAAWGQMLAYAFILFGIFTAIGGDAFGGIWIGFIGWFLLNAAQAAVAHVSIHGTLAGLQARQVMSSDCLCLPGTASISDLLENYLLKTGERYSMIVTDGKFEGLVTLHEIKTIPRDEWERTPLRSIAIQPDRLAMALPNEPVEEVLRKMGERNINQLPVVEDGKLIGVIARDHLLAVIQNRLEFSKH